MIIRDLVGHVDILLPPTIAELIRTIEAAPRQQTVDDAIAAGSSALLEYNQLPAKVKAAHLLRLRHEKAEVNAALAAAMEQKVAEHEQDPTAESAIRAGKACMQAGDARRAEKLFARAAELAEDRGNLAAAYAYRGDAVLKSAGGRGGMNAERVKQAELLFEQASKLRPDHGLSLDAGTRVAGPMAQDIKNIKDITKGDDDFNAEGLSQLLAGDFDAAKEAFEMAVEFDPDNTEYLLNLSLTCSYAGQFGRAAKLAIRSLKRNPSGRANNLVLATAGMRAVILRAQG